MGCNRKRIKETWSIGGCTAGRVNLQLNLYSCCSRESKRHSTLIRRWNGMSSLVTEMPFKRERELPGNATLQQMLLWRTSLLKYFRDIEFKLCYLQTTLIREQNVQTQKTYRLDSRNGELARKHGTQWVKKAESKKSLHTDTIAFIPIKPLFVLHMAMSFLIPSQDVATLWTLHPRRRIRPEHMSKNTFSSKRVQPSSELPR